MPKLLLTILLAGVVVLSCATLPRFSSQRSWLRNVPLITEEEEGDYIIRVEAFANPDREIAVNKIRELQVLLKDKIYLVFVAPNWRVEVGDFTSKYSAEMLKRELQSMGYSDARVVSIKVESEEEETK